MNKLIPQLPMLLISFLVVISSVGCSIGFSKNVRNAFPPDYKLSHPVNMTVSSFQNGFTMPVGSKFTIYVPNELTSDLEFKEYSNILSSYLIRQGYEKTNIDKADYSIILLYGIDDGRTEAFSYSYPTYGMVSGGSTQYHSGAIYGPSGRTATYSGTTVTAPVYGQTGTASGTKTYRVYKRTVEISVVDLASSKAKKELVISSTVKIDSEGGTGLLRVVMPLFLNSAVNAIGRHGVYRRSVESIPYFSASEIEAEKAVMKVGAEHHGELLAYSAQNGDLLTVKNLILRGVDPNTRAGKRMRSTLEWAVYSRNFALVKYLLEKGALVDDGAKEQASSTRQNDMLAMFRAYPHGNPRQ